MPTRALIGFKDPETEKVSVIYNHFDGYPKYLGNLLQNYYKDAKKVKALMKLGNVSFLRKSIEAPPLNYVFSNIPAPYSCFYGRDRGDSNCGAREYDDMNSALNEFKNSWAEYIYVYDNNVWYVYMQDIEGFEPVENVLSKC